MKKNRILFINDNLSVASGTMTYIMNFLENNHDNKFVFEILYFEETDTNYKEYLDVLNVKYHYIKSNLSASVISLNKFQKQLKYFFNTNKYVAVHSHTPNYNLFVFSAAKKNLIKTRISHSHSSKSSKSKIRIIRNTALNILGGLFTTNNVACSYEASLANISPFSKDDVIILKNGINLSKYSKNDDSRRRIKQDLGLKDSKIIGHVGRLSEEKNHDFLLKIFMQIRLLDSSYKLVLIGDGPLRDKLESQVRDMQLCNDVIFLGERRNANDLLNIFDVFVMPSLFEGFGLAALESQAMDIHTIISEHLPESLNLSDYIHRVSINEDASVWADVVINLQLERPGNAHAQIRNSGYDITTCITELLEYYESVIEMEDVHCV